jgi:hypothetical protein
MASFAKLNSDNIVEQVISIVNELLNRFKWSRARTNWCRFYK